MARRRPADDRTSPEGVSNVGGEVGRWAAAAGAGQPRSLCTDTPWGYAGIALRRRLGRCYPLRALGAGDVRGRRQQPSGGGGAGSGRPASSDGRRSDVPPPTHLIPQDPWPRYQSSSIRTQVLSNEWTPSRYGEPPWVNSRSHCRPPITRRGCATLDSSTSTSNASGSPSPTASRRTGWRPATAR